MYSITPTKLECIECQDSFTLENELREHQFCKHYQSFKEMFFSFNDIMFLMWNGFDFDGHAEQSRTSVTERRET